MATVFSGIQGIGVKIEADRNSHNSAVVFTIVVE